MFCFFFFLPFWAKHQNQVLTFVTYFVSYNCKEDMFMVCIVDNINLVILEIIKTFILIYCNFKVKTMNHC